MVLARILVPVALLWQAANVVQVEASSSSSSSSSTTYTQLLLSECSVQIDACGADSACAPCLTAMMSAGLLAGSTTTSGTDCAYSYATFCDAIQSVGCDTENAFVDNLAACAADVTFTACDGFESCSVTAPTNTAPTSSPTSTFLPQSASVLLPSVTPTASPSSTDDANTLTAVPTSSPTSTFLTQTPSVGPTATPTAFLSSMPTMTPTASPSSTETMMPTASPSSAPTMMPTASPSSMPTMTPTASPSSIDDETAAPTSSPTLTTMTPTPSVMSTMEPPTPSPLSTDDDGERFISSGASRRLQGVWSTASLCFSLAYVARAYAA